MNSIDYSKLRSLTAREIISALIRDGFVLDRTSGSHYQFIHSDKRRVTVSYHSSGETFGPGMLKSMFQIQAKWTEEDLRRLKLIK
jgi:predicted RNA binding protein YcfA (HicA-like mRNA interferase family)